MQASELGDAAMVGSFQTRVLGLDSWDIVCVWVCGCLCVCVFVCFCVLIAELRIPAICCRDNFSEML